MIASLLFIFTVALGQQGRPPQVIVGEIKDRLAELEQVLGPQTVPASQLQAALDKGGDIHLVKGAIYPLSITVRSNTTLHCHGAGFIGEKKIPAVPAIDILPGTSHVVLEDCAATSPADWVIRIGRNTATEQGTLDQVPTDIVFRNVGVPTHRGKRAFEVNGELTCYACTGYDVRDMSGQDSQVVWIGNSAGNDHFIGGEFCGGTETFLIGGDTLKLPAGVIPTDISLDGTRLCHPLAWQTDAEPDKVKNLFEAKTGNKIRVERVAADGSWQDGQDGYAFVVTPKAWGEIHDIQFIDVTATNVASGFQITGADNNTVTPAATSGFVARRVWVTASKARYGGRGTFALIGTEPADLLFDDCVGIVDGTKLFEYAFGTRRLSADGTLVRKDGHLGSLTITNGHYTVGTYSLSLAGQQNAANPSLSVDTLVVTGNVFTGASSTLKKNLPLNTYSADRASFDALFVNAAGGDYRLKAVVQ